VADGFEIGKAFIRISPDTDDFAEELKGQVEEATAGAEGKVKVGAEDDDLKAVLADAKAKLDELNGRTARPVIGADDDELRAAVDNAKAGLDELDGKEARPVLDLEAADFGEKVDQAHADLDDIGGRTARPRLDLDKDEFDAQVAEANAQLDELQAKASALQLGGAGAGAGAGGGAEGSLIGAATFGIGSLLPGAAGAGMGLGLLAGTGALAFGGIAQALSAAHQSSQNSGLTGAQLAATNFSNSVQLAQAQQSVTQAREQAAQNAITSANSIEQADMSLAETERNTAASRIQALEQVQQAQQGVKEATYSLGQANYSLGQAYEQAREQIVSLNDQLADSKLSVRAASLAVQQAEYQEKQVNANALSTQLQREQAALAVAQAKQQLKDATDREKDSQVAANLANKQGVQGSQAVIQAKHAQAQAVQQLQNAHQAEADAQRNLRNTELNNAAQVKAAQMQAAMAREQAAYQQKTAAQSVANAERNVTDTIKEQQLQMAAMKSTSNSAANQFAKDMARLTPAGQGFVKQILSMKGGFKELEDAAQNATLPGFTSFLHGVSSLMPSIRSAVSGMGTAISGAFAGFGKELASPKGEKVFDGLVKNGMQFANIVLPAFANFFGQLGLLGSKSGAVTGLADLLAGVGNGLAGFAEGLTPYIPQFDQIFEAIGKFLTAFGPALAQDIGLIATVLAPLAKILNNGTFGGPVIHGLAQIAAGMLLFKGALKLLPGFLSKPLAEAAGKLGGWAKAPLKKLGGQIGEWAKQAGGQIAGWAKQAGTTLAGWAQTAGSTLATWGKTGAQAVSTWASNAGTAISGWASTAGSTIAGWATSFGGWMVSAGQAAATFVAGLGARLAEAATATGAWIAENSVAAATYIASNLAMAASATAAFVAENAATLGLGLVIAGLVGAIIYLATHWHQVFTNIKNWTLDAYHNVIEPVFHGIETGALWLWHSVFEPVWHGIEEGTRNFVHGVAVAWGKLESAFKTPANFLIKTVYDDGIRNFWDKVVGAIGLSSLNLPYVSPLAGGGVMPGYAPGHDVLPALLSPGEAVLTPDATRAIGGAPVVNALNAAYAPAGATSGRGRYAAGGVAGNILSGAWDVAKAVTALVTGNQVAFTNALAPLIGTSASGKLGQVMVALPRALIGDAAKSVMKLFAGTGTMGTGTAGGRVAVLGGPSPYSGGLTAQVIGWFAQAVKAAGVPATWIPGLEEIAKYESGYNPLAVNNTAAGIAAGLPEGVMQTIGATFQKYHVPGTSLSIFDPVANIAAAARYIRYDYGNPDNTPGLLALAQGKQYTGYDSGGWLQPGMSIPVNQTGRPEAVLTPEESAAFIAMVRNMLSRGSAPSGGGATAVANYYGPQYPSAEQNAIIMRDLALTIGG
jgi:hypothetical protein